jgi:hypothetical protein
VTISFGGGGFIGETGFVISCGSGETEILSAAGAEVPPTPKDLSSYAGSTCTIEMTDSYGDGWNFNILTIGSATFYLDDYSTDGG